MSAKAATDLQTTAAIDVIRGILERLPDEATRLAVLERVLEKRCRKCLDYSAAAMNLTANRISEVIGAVLTERNLYVVKPQHPTMGEIALEAYGFGKACDAAALQGDDLQALLAEIGARCAVGVDRTT